MCCLAFNAKKAWLDKKKSLEDNNVCKDQRFIGVWFFDWIGGIFLQMLANSEYSSCSFTDVNEKSFEKSELK